MIVKPSIAFNDFAGSAKGVTARNVKGRNNAVLIVAELNQDGYESIPISQKYQDQIAKIV